MLDVAKRKRWEHRTGGPSGWIRTEVTDQVRWNATDVDTLRTSWARRDPNLRSSCLSSRNDLPQKERHCVRRHSARRAPRGHEKAMATWRQRPGPKQIQAEGPYRRSVVRPAAKSAKDVTKKERGMARVSDSDQVTNCGMEDRQATPATKVTMEDRACSSPTLLAVARAN